MAYHKTAGPSTTILSTELRYSNDNNSNDNNLFGVLLQADTSTGSAMPPREHDASHDRVPAWNLQTDYTHPWGTGTKLETGFKGTTRSTGDNSTVAYLDSASGVYTPDASRANTFDYHERIGAVYAVLSQQIGKVQTQGGLRLEEATTRFTLPTVGQAYDNRYSSAFPSAILSYNFTDMRQVKLSYSRRISRPNPWQLSPIVNRNDARHVVPWQSVASSGIHRRDGDLVPGHALVGIHADQSISAEDRARRPLHPDDRYHRYFGCHLRQRGQHARNGH